MPSPQVPAALLDVAWVHSHEEDTPTEAVYRPAGWAFPPSRGRAGFTLRADGTALESGPGPTDRATTAAATWSAQPDGSVALVRAGPTPTRRALRIVSATKDRLVLRR